MSRAEMICSSAGRPLGLTKCDCVMPSRCAVWFIWSAKFSIEPATPSASTTAMSFADFTSSILSALSTVNVVPVGKPILTGSCATALGETGEQRVERDAAFLDRAQRHVGRHDLGDGGRDTRERWRSRRTAPCRCRPRPAAMLRRSARRRGETARTAQVTSARISSSQGSGSGRETARVTVRLLSGAGNHCSTAARRSAI